MATIALASATWSKPLYSGVSVGCPHRYHSASGRGGAGGVAVSLAAAAVS